MKRITMIAPTFIFTLLLSISIGVGIPPEPTVDKITVHTTDKKDKPIEPKRIFDRRIAWGLTPENPVYWDEILAQYGE